MAIIGTSLLDILEPPANPWLRALGAGKVRALPGVRLVRHECGEEDTLERNERLRQARRKLHDFADL